MPNRLKKLVIDRVDLCAKGANPEAHIVLFKRDGAVDPDSVEKAETLDEVLARQEQEAEAWRDKWRTMDAFIESLRSIADVEDRNDKLTLITTSANQFIDRMSRIEELLPEEGDIHMSEKAQDTKKTDELTVDEFKEKLQKMTEERDEAAAKVTEVMEQLAKETESKDDEDIWKDVNPVIKQQFDEMSAQIAKAEAVAHLEKENRVRQECIAKIGEYQYLPVNPDDDVELFKAISELPNEISKRVYELFKAGDEAFSKSGINKERGFETPDNEGLSTIDRIEKMVSEKISKASESLSYQDALQQVMDENPDLYNTYANEVQSRK